MNIKFFHLFFLLLYLITNCSFYNLANHPLFNTPVDKENFKGTILINPPQNSEPMIIDSFPLELDIQQGIPITNISIQTPNTIYSIDPEFSTDNSIQKLKIEQHISLSNHDDFNPDNSHYPITITMKNLSNELITTNIAYNLITKSPHYKIELTNKIPKNDTDWNSPSFALEIYHYPTGAKIDKISIKTSLSSLADISFETNEYLGEPFKFQLNRLGSRVEKDLIITIEVNSEYKEAEIYKKTLVYESISFVPEPEPKPLVLDILPLELYIKQLLPIKNISIQTPNTTYNLNPDSLDQNLIISQQISPSNQGAFNPENTLYPITINMRNISNEVITTNLNYNLIVESPHYTIQMPNQIPEDWNSETATIEVIELDSGGPIKHVSIETRIGSALEMTKPYKLDLSKFSKPSINLIVTITITPIYGIPQTIIKEISAPK